MIDKLIKYFRQYTSLQEDEVSLIKEIIPVRNISKNTRILEEGKISKEFYFILEGGVRLFYNYEGTEKTAFFYFENQFVSSYESFTKQVPAKHNLQTIEDSKLAFINQEAAMQLVTQNPKFDFLARVMMEEELIIYQNIIANFITMNAEQRYRSLLESNPMILQRIPQHQLATFLGVSPETLSRIRKRISSKSIS